MTVSRSDIPLLMVAPNGARRDKDSHCALPITIGELVATAAASYQAGADAMHTHVRNKKGVHVLDAGLCRELLQEMTIQVPEMTVQLTTESAGYYSPDAQRKFLYALRPTEVSVALAEMLSDGDIKSATRLYHWAADNDVRVQHILRTAQEIKHLAELKANNIIPDGDLWLLFVLGSYEPAVNASPAMLEPFVNAFGDLPTPAAFMACAFGGDETACLLAAAAAGGGCRVGFENNLHHPDGKIACDNAARVAEVSAALKKQDAEEK